MKKKMKYIKGFILYALLCIFAFMPFMSFNVNAWTQDIDGNLISDNLLDNNSSLFEQGAISNQPGVSYNGNKVSLNTRIRTINLISLDSSTTYTISVASGFDCNVQAYNSNGYQSNETSSPFNTWAQNWTFTGYSMYAFAFRKNDNSTITLSDLPNIKIMLCEGSSVKPYEPYGTYYSENTMDKMVQSSFGAFAYASAIRLYYNNGSVTQLYKIYSNCYDMALEEWCSFRNGSLNIDDFKLIFTTLGGNSSWSYNIGVDFPSYAIKVSTFKDWYFYGYSKFEFISYSNTYVLKSSYEAMNPFVLDLTNNSINNLNASDYIKTINYYRRNPNIGIAYGQFGTPNDSIYYNDGYNDGIEKGYDNGFDSGFTDGKNEGYQVGYNDGYRDGNMEDFTTNGFKTLIGSIFNYPINFIRGVFNFEFMGINISSLVFFALSIAIVIFVIRRFKK